VTLPHLTAPSVQCSAATYRIHLTRHTEEQQKHPTTTYASFSDRNYG